MVGQVVADARVALTFAARALRGYAKDAPPTQALRGAQRLLAQLVPQHIEEEPEEGGGPRIRRATATDRIVAETESGVILVTNVRGGHVHDREGAAALVAQAQERSGQELEEVLGNTAYGDGETREAIEALSAEGVAKAPSGTRKETFNRTDFRVDAKRGVAHCPAGKPSIPRDAVFGGDLFRDSHQRSRCQCRMAAPQRPHLEAHPKLPDYRRSRPAPADSQANLRLRLPVALHDALRTHPPARSRCSARWPSPAPFRRLDNRSSQITRCERAIQRLAA